jgi:hypothetical protein
LTVFSVDHLPKWFELYDAETAQPYYLEADSLVVSWELPEKMFGTPLPFSSYDDSKLQKRLGRQQSQNRDTYSGGVSDSDDIISFADGPETSTLDENDSDVTPLRLPKAAPRPKPNLIKTDVWFQSITGCCEDDFNKSTKPFTLFPDGSLGMSEIVCL